MKRYRFSDDADELDEFIGELRLALYTYLWCGRALWPPDGSSSLLAVNQIPAVREQFDEARRTLRRMTHGRNESAAYEMLEAAATHQAHLADV